MTGPPNEERGTPAKENAPLETQPSHPQHTLDAGEIQLVLHGSDDDEFEMPPRPSWGPLLPARAGYTTVKLGALGIFSPIRVAWPRPRDAALTLGAVLRGEPQCVPEYPWARTLEIEDSDGELVDEVAWVPDAPDAWWTRKGAPILGAAEITRAEILGRPLLLCSTPQAWLDNHGPAGYWPAACILSWDCCLDLWLGDVREIRADTPQLEEVLTDRLVKSCPPRFRVVGMT